MKIINGYVGYVLATLMVSLVPVLPAIAHTENQGWGHHMAGRFWAFGPMILFWVVGVLLVVLLTVTLLKSLKDW
ncbi:MAG: hypothetical protein V5A87_04110 [Candidatus Bipolaricaulota bacterium]|nr:hypothetical protein [Candidatus Bipolaricaulota bacterium]